MPDSPEFDVIIIGAGINGAGIARDAAMRGLKVLLLDKGDIASGTSSASTRLIHGGLRYLEHFEFGLVRESLRERETLLRIAPHLVKPLAITIPIYKQSTRGPLTIRAGMIAYDLLSIGKSLPRHRMLSRAETLAEWPGLNPEGLLGSAVYFDSQVEFAERLVVENALAARDRGAEVVTYAPVTKLVADGEVLRGVEFVSDGETYVARASVFINAAGPWVDHLLERAPVESPRLIGGTKGSHIVVPAFPGASKNAIYLEAQSDRRPFFIIPWNGNYLIGTTDVRFEDDPDKVRSEFWEIDYLLAETNRAFPGARLTRDQILFTYSGVRPLPWTRNEDEQSITRRHFIREHPKLKNLLSIVGGKLTTYRSLAVECVDLVFRKLGRQSPACLTAQEVLKSTPTRELTEAVVFSFEHELAKTLADCFLRRTMRGLNADLGLGDLEAAAEIGMRLLGWSNERAKCEIEHYKREMWPRICGIHDINPLTLNSDSRAKRF
ncbi:MAG TPA: glycerol-3-phosphate dehydrogenase/oxidase [Pyrinomonadaceae bacterium]|nr:glycerol-3-phosphate dehydrogenase/oxidase [Pyrinomonadaceae bacterium]